MANRIERQGDAEDCLDQLGLAPSKAGHEAGIPGLGQEEIEARVKDASESLSGKSQEEVYAVAMKMADRFMGKFTAAEIQDLCAGTAIAELHGTDTLREYLAAMSPRTLHLFAMAAKTTLLTLSEAKRRKG